MLFNSIEFLIFFPIVTFLYFVLPHKMRWFLLLAASCGFYMAFIPIYILILFFTIIIDYAAGIIIENAEGRRRKMWLVISIVSNVGVLAFFKYFNFLNTNLTDLAQFLHWNYPVKNLGILLPIGLSFHTFQAMSYTIEVYRGNQKPERHLGIYALYVMFYPQLVAGPIERPQNLIHQFREKHVFDYTRVTDGLKLMLWGFFKKIVIADRLAELVNQVYDHSHQYHGVQLIIATYFFAFQIYCDFSGYSDIAIGAAQVMGFKLMDNFNRPYFSKNIAEFWKRWHISLSTWFKDYLYIPLGGNRVGKSRWYFNLFIVFLISGLWHGANWTFIVWGGLHGFYLVSSIWTEKLRHSVVRSLGLDRHPTLMKYTRAFITFHLVVFAWIFFRASSIREAMYVVTHLFSGLSFAGMLNGLGLDAFQFAFAICSILFMEVIHLMQRHRKMRHFFSEKPWWFRWAVYYALVMAILFFGKTGQQQFIYFQF
ncbi:MAG: MBOAT family O-acyltransferase [Candidatus Kapaibacterium sp.]|jgi:alginate O-acetyltransferase complex protein AlgI